MILSGVLFGESNQSLKYLPTEHHRLPRSLNLPSDSEASKTSIACTSVLVSSSDFVDGRTKP
jgi:hypothetical protein